jgi:hypothetical protein
MLHHSIHVPLFDYISYRVRGWGARGGGGRGGVIRDTSANLTAGVYIDPLLQSPLYVTLKSTAVSFSTNTSGTAGPYDVGPIRFHMMLRPIQSDTALSFERLSKRDKTRQQFRFVCLFVFLASQPIVVVFSTAR